MLRVKKVLVPTDFSTPADAALAPICHWARRLDAEIHFVHVLESMRPDLYPAALAVTDPVMALGLEQEARAELEVRRRRALNQGVSVGCGTAQAAAAAPAILEYAEAHDADLIAMSTHGRRGVRRLLLGSVAEEVVQRSSCPVLTFASGPRSGHHLWPQRILAAVDLSEHSRAVVVHAKELAAIFRAELQLLHVVVRPSLPACCDGAGLPTLVYESPLLEREARRALEALYVEAAGPAGPWSVHVGHGVAQEEIVRFAEVNSCELIVVASHGLTGVSHLLMGSVSERVVRGAPCPVLTVKSFGKSMIGPASRAQSETADEVAVGAQATTQPRGAC